MMQDHNDLMMQSSYPLESMEKTGVDADNPNHNTPPSRVIHCRAVAVGSRETDVIEVMKVFGSVKALKLIPKTSQALVEFELIESAIACVTYSRVQPIILNGRRMFVNYSKSNEITINRNPKTHNSHTSPTHVLLMTVINVMYHVDVDTIKTICQQQNVYPQRIVIFHKNGLQVLVEFQNVDDACRIFASLNGCDIYPGCCSLKIEYSRIEKLNVRANTAEMYSVDVPETQTAVTPYASNQAPQAGQYYNGYSNPAQPYDSSGQGQVIYPISQTNYLDQYTSPFTENVVGTNGGEGCVAMVYGINNEVINCDHLFNLFCLYGNVMKVKILENKDGMGMVQYVDKLSTEMAIQYLNNLCLFGHHFQVAFSKHSFIMDSPSVIPLPDNTPSTVDFQQSRNNRFKPVPNGRNDLFSRIHAPSKVLHYFNAPPDCVEERIHELFVSFNAEKPLKQLAVSKPGSKSSSGLVEFSSISSAVEALMLVNHVTLRKDVEAGEPIVHEKGGAPFTFKLAFSTSETINTRD